MNSIHIQIFTMAFPTLISLHLFHFSSLWWTGTILSIKFTFKMVSPVPIDHFVWTIENHKFASFIICKSSPQRNAILFEITFYLQSIFNGASRKQCVKRAIQVYHQVGEVANGKNVMNWKFGLIWITNGNHDWKGRKCYLENSQNDVDFLMNEEISVWIHSGA